MPLDPVIGGSLISGGFKLLGGLFGKGKKKDAREQARLVEEQRYKWLVKGAEAAGFNPLTVLRSTGGAMAPQMATPLSSRELIGEAIADFGGTFAQDAIQRASEERQNAEWQRRYDYQLENPLRPVSSRASVGQTVREDSLAEPKTATASNPSGKFLFPAMDQRVSIRLPTGQDAWMLKTQADRLGITPGDMLTLGEMSETVGEVAGEAAGLLQIDTVLDEMFRTGILTPGGSGAPKANRFPVKTKQPKPRPRVFN